MPEIILKLTPSRRFKIEVVRFSSRHYEVSVGPKTSIMPIKRLHVRDYKRAMRFAIVFFKQFHQKGLSEEEQFLDLYDHFSQGWKRRVSKVGFIRLHKDGQCRCPIEVVVSGLLGGVVTGGQTELEWAHDHLFDPHLIRHIIDVADGAVRDLYLFRRFLNGAKFTEELTQ